MHIIDVISGVIEKDGKILIAQRGPGKRVYLEDKWEFPGGKIEAGETPEVCLARELREELGIETWIGALISDSEYTYPDFTVRLRAYHVTYLSGEFKLNVHQAIAWIGADELDAYNFVPAEGPIVQKLKDARN